MQHPSQKKPQQQQQQAQQQTPFANRAANMQQNSQQATQQRLQQQRSVGHLPQQQQQYQQANLQQTLPGHTPSNNPIPNHIRQQSGQANPLQNHERRHSSTRNGDHVFSNSQAQIHSFQPSNTIPSQPIYKPNPQHISQHGNPLPSSGQYPNQPNSTSQSNNPSTKIRPSNLSSPSLNFHTSSTHPNTAGMQNIPTQMRFASHNDLTASPRASTGPTRQSTPNFDGTLRTRNMFDSGLPTSKVNQYSVRPNPTHPSQIPPNQQKPNFGNTFSQHNTGILPGAHSSNPRPNSSTLLANKTQLPSRSSPTSNIHLDRLFSQLEPITRKQCYADLTRLHHHQIDNKTFMQTLETKGGPGFSKKFMEVVNLVCY